MPAVLNRPAALGPEPVRPANEVQVDLRGDRRCRLRRKLASGLIDRQHRVGAFVRVDSQDHHPLAPFSSKGQRDRSVVGQILCSWSHAGRLRSEAAFAALAGAAPIPASSGQTVRHRLNRGGDRQLMWALHTIVLSRLAHHEETRVYASKRTAQGRTPREIKRSLKRHLATRLFKLLEDPTGALDDHRSILSIAFVVYI
jgi:hypothetical protein